ncbi:spinster family MFS transporter [Novosphingobium piscinae]|uniref:MFS transporter n=1 Tax=Novosphingobium piscinae TaxID=1507448 RepID=A0A7X1FVF0_9SPHN|nr:MFS transporter [Novosphingobium piscinae]MBC2667699.1 MFS transporter [Novosphingobium piscinae]
MTPPTTPTQAAGDPVLPSMAYRGWFLFVMMLVSASVTGERFMMAVMVEPIKAELGLTDTQIGLSKDLAVTLVYLIAVIPLARLADRWSKRKIVALAATTWSLAVLLCGQARSFLLLLAGRAAIGLGEGAFTPPSQSWIADLFPMRQRATALAIFLLGASLGHLTGPALGGWLTSVYGWRHAMMMAALPGVVLVPLVLFTLREIPPGLADGNAAAAARTEPFWATLRQILAVPTLPLLMLGAGLTTLLTMGLVSWVPAYMDRSFGMSPREAGLGMGGALFLGSLVGHSVGGPLSDWLGRRDLRWYLWIQVVSAIGAASIGFVMLTGSGQHVFLLLGLNMMIGGLSAAPLMAVISGLAPVHARSVAVAVLMVVINVVGLGGGPLFVGWLSDVLTPHYGTAALGMAMRAVLLVGLPSAALSYFASRVCLADFARSGSWDASRPAATALH